MEQGLHVLLASWSHLGICPYPEFGAEDAPTEHMVPAPGMGEEVAGGGHSSPEPIQHDTCLGAARQVVWQRSPAVYLSAQGRLCLVTNKPWDPT